MNTQRPLEFGPGTSEEGIARSIQRGPALEGVERWFLAAQLRAGSGYGRKKKRPVRCRPPQLPYDDP